MLSRDQTLSPRDLARVVGLSESSLKRWADDGLLQITRTPGGHRRIAIAEAASYIRRSGRKLQDSAPLGLSPLAEADHSTMSVDRLDHLLVQAIVRGQASVASGLAVRMYLSGRSVCEICDGPFTHALRQVESTSPAGLSLPASLASVSAALEQLGELLPDAAQHCCVALARREPEILTSMADVVLLAERWKRVTVNWTTNEALAHQAREHEASFVCLSDDHNDASLTDLAETLRRNDCKLLVIGRAAALIRPTTNLYTALSMSELASFARCVDAERTLIDAAQV